MAWIYALADPVKPSEIRYIGRTVECLSKRLSGHLRDLRIEKSHKINWLKKLQSEGRTPIIWPIEQCSNDDVENREAHWIWFFKPLKTLTNTRHRCSGGRKTGMRYPPSQAVLVHVKKMNERKKGSKYKLTDIGRRERALKMSRFRGRFKNESHKAQFYGMLKSRKKARKTYAMRRKGKGFVSETHKAQFLEMLRTRSLKPRSAEYRHKLGEAGRLRKGKGCVSEAHKNQILALSAARRKPVKCVETGEIFQSVQAAQGHIGIRKIFSAIKRNGTCGGKHWEFV